MPGLDTQSVFISHSSASAAAAARLERAFEAAGVDVWLDASDLGVGTLLRNELNQAIGQSRSVVLVWSEAASRSRWVSAEILTAFHMNRFILPCVTDDTPLPQFLSRSVYLDLRKAGDDGVRRLVRDASTAPERANPLPPRVAAPSGELLLAYNRLGRLQEGVTGRLSKRDVTGAADAQARLELEMAQAELRWPFELRILNLAGYHRKNGYLVKHWGAIQAGRAPRDPLLHEGERLFFEAALVDPNDVSALNGLASILIYEFELDAAAFFNERAIALSKKANIPYDAAEHDRQMIAWLRQQAAGNS
jgi:hypothetical protein